MTAVGLKVVILGASGAGKTSLFERFTHDNDGEDAAPTVGADFGRKIMASSSGNHFVLGLWDTAGHERFNSLIPLFYRGAGAAIICHDLSNKESWGKAKFWANELKNKEEGCKIYVCGTKSDLVKAGAQRTAAEEDVKSFAEEIKAKYVETSSKTGKNIDKLLRVIVDDFENSPSGTVIENITLTGTEVKSKCC